MGTKNNNPRKDIDLDWVEGIDYAETGGFTSYREWVIGLSHKSFQGGVIPKVWNGLILGEVVLARIDFERWVVDCPSQLCAGAESVDLNEPLFFCHSCGNVENNHNAYPVEFPPPVLRSKIYGELKKRPLQRPVGQSRIKTAELSRPLDTGLGRSWNPGETVEDLKGQRKQRQRLVSGKIDLPKRAKKKKRTKK